jgi:hypothetical protein
MDKKKIIIVALGFDARVLAQSTIKDCVGVVIVDSLKEVEELKNQSFQPDPIPFLNYRKELYQPKIKDYPRNKFIDKPKHNYRRK